MYKQKGMVGGPKKERNAESVHYYRRALALHPRHSDAVPPSPLLPLPPPQPHATAPRCVAALR